jgi:outer membrane lipoprotein-sorting protein
MMDRRRFLSGLGALSVSLSWGRAARADAAADALAEIAKARASLKTLVAPFTQERTIGLLASAVKSDGEMTLVRPDRLRWELKPPDAIVYWITPDGFAYATPTGGASVGKAAAGKFGAVLGDMLVLLGGDLSTLRARYDLSVQRSDTGATLTLKPKAEEVKKQVRSLELSAGPELWTMRRVVIEEKNGDKSVITFGKLDRDVKVDPAKMQPPKPQ